MSTLADHHHEIGLSAGRAPSDPARVGTRAGATDDDPVTGPTPVLDLAEGHLHVSSRRGVHVVSVDGGLDEILAERLAPLVTGATADATAVVLDLDQATILERRAVVALGLACRHVPDRCIVAGRLSGRLVLERWGLDDEYVLFTSVADALQARSFLESGYGTGWMTRTEVQARR